MVWRRHLYGLAPAAEVEAAVPRLKRLVPATDAVRRPVRSTVGDRCEVAIEGRRANGAADRIRRGHKPLQPRDRAWDRYAALLQQAGLTRGVFGLDLSFNEDDRRSLPDVERFEPHARGPQARRQDDRQHPPRPQLRIRVQKAAGGPHHEVLQRPAAALRTGRMQAAMPAVAAAQGGGDAHQGADLAPGSR
jgi:hypothetical protein